MARPAQGRPVRPSPSMPRNSKWFRNPLCHTAARQIEDLSNAGEKGRFHGALRLEIYAYPHVFIVTRTCIFPGRNRPTRSITQSMTAISSTVTWCSQPRRRPTILDSGLERGGWITPDGLSGRTNSYHSNLKGRQPIGAHDEYAQALLNQASNTTGGHRA